MLRWISVLLIFGAVASCALHEREQVRIPPPDGFALITPETERRFRAALPRLTEIQQRKEDELLAIPGVRSVGLSLRGGEPVFLLGTTADVSRDRIPDEIEGVAVVARVVGQARVLDGNPNCRNGAGPPCHIQQEQLPVSMGNSGRWSGQSGGCTIGFKACDNATGEAVFVTNSHCAQFNSPPMCPLADLGDAVFHPSLGDASTVGATPTNIGNISGHAAPSCASSSNFVDATKVDSTFFQTSTNVRDIGQPNGFDLDPSPNQLVQYSGRTAGRNFGWLIAVNVTVDVPAAGGFCCGPLRMRDQLEFDPVGPVIGGDSGSGLFTISQVEAARDRVLIGLLWGSDLSGEGVAYANRLDRIAEALDINYDIQQGVCSPR